MKKFFTTYIIKPNAKQNIRNTPHETVLFTCAVMFLPFMLLMYFMIVDMKNDMREYEQSQIVEIARLKYIVMNNDYTYSYMVKLKNGDYRIIERGESQTIDNNPYIGRPVKIYKNGTVK